MCLCLSYVSYHCERAIVTGPLCFADRPALCWTTSRILTYPPFAWGLYNPFSIYSALMNLSVKQLLRMGGGRVGLGLQHSAFVLVPCCLSVMCCEPGPAGCRDGHLCRFFNLTLLLSLFSSLLLLLLLEVSVITLSENPPLLS